MSINYITTIIDQRHRHELNVSEREYALLDAVYQLQQMTGTCHASKGSIGNMLGGIAKATIVRLVEKLVAQKLLRKTKNGRLLKVTATFEKGLNKPFYEQHQSARTVTKRHRYGDETSPKETVNPIGFHPKRHRIGDDMTPKPKIAAKKSGDDMTPSGDETSPTERYQNITATVTKHHRYGDDMTPNGDEASPYILLTTNNSNKVSSSSIRLGDEMTPLQNAKVVVERYGVSAQLQEDKWIPFAAWANHLVTKRIHLNQNPKKLKETVQLFQAYRAEELSLLVKYSTVTKSYAHLYPDRLEKLKPKHQSQYNNHETTATIAPNPTSRKASRYCPRVAAKYDGQPAS